MDRDDWRVRVELEEGHAGGLLERLGFGLGSRARELAHELEAHRLPVSREGGTVFVYASSGFQAEQARRVVEAELAEMGIQPKRVVIERWLAAEDRWDDEPEGPDVEEELVARGYAPWAKPRGGRRSGRRAGGGGVRGRAALALPDRGRG